MRPVRPILALSAVTLLGACGTGTGASGSSATGSVDGPTPATSTPATSSTTSPSTTTAPSADPENPSVPPRPGSKVRLQVVTGSVSDGVESGCLLLTPSPTDPNGPWMLIGNVAGIKAGQQVTVRGYRVEDMASTCQQGRPFRVDAVVTG